MEPWAYVYLCAAIALVLALLFLVIKWPLSIHKTFSMHAAQTKALSVYYFVVFAVTMPLMTLSLVVLAPSLQLPFIASLLLLLATLAQITCTLFPEKDSRQKIITHRTFAGISAALLLACLAVLTLDSSFINQVYNIGLIAMIGAALSAVMLKEKFSLITQSVFYLAFLVPTILLVAQ